jgi:YVTN family beta-propeller protein
LVIDTATNTVLKDVEVGAVPIGVAITPDGARAYVANEVSGGVSVIDTTTNTVVATIPVEGGFAVAITPDGTRAYVANGDVSVVDTASNTVIATISGLLDSIAIAITPDGTRAYVNNRGNPLAHIAPGVSVIDTATNTVVMTIPVEGTPIALAITPVRQAPTSKEQCKRGGYRSFGSPAGPFRNQGQCISYVEHHRA